MDDARGMVGAALEAMDAAMQGGTVKDRLGAVKLMMRALEVSHLDPSIRSLLLSRLAMIQLSLYDSTQEGKWLRDGLASLESAVVDDRTNTEDQLLSLGIFWREFRKRPSEFHSSSDWERMVLLTSDQSRFLEADRELHLNVSMAACFALDSLISARVSVDVFDALIDLSEQCLRLNESSPDYWEQAGMHAGYLLRRAEFMGSRDQELVESDVRQALHLLDQLLSRLPEGHEFYPHLLTEKATAYRELFHVLGTIEALNEAIRLSRQAFVSAHDETTWQIGQNLAMMLTDRFDRYGSSEDLIEAREVLARSEPSKASLKKDPSYATQSFINQASVYLSIASITADVSDFDRAVDASQKAVEVASPDSLVLTGEANSSLALALLWRHATIGNSGGSWRARRRLRMELQRAVSAARRAAEISALAEFRAAERKMLLATALETSFEATSRAAEIDEAIPIVRDLLVSLAAGSARHLEAANILASCLKKRFHALQDLKAGEEALTLFSYVAATASPDFLRRLSAAGNWVDLAENVRPDSEECLEANRTVVDLLPDLVWVGAETSDAFRRILGWPSFATSAAAAFIDAGQELNALRLLEKGRAVVWSQLSRDEVGQSETVVAQAPALAAEIMSLRRQLRSLYATDEPALGPSSDARFELFTRWEALKREATQIDPSLGSLGQVNIEVPVKGSPVIVINVAARRCDALITSTTGVDVVPLPSLHQEDVVAKVDQYRRAMKGGTRADEQSIFGILEWLWKAIASPVVDHLSVEGITGERTAPGRVYWCPTGALGLLPLHLAGSRDRGPGGRLVGMHDLAVSSYLPTLARPSLPSREPTDSRWLVVGVSHSDVKLRADSSTFPDLFFVPEEVALLRTALNDQCIVREDASAVSDTILRDVRQTSRVHFSCHGVVDLNEPAQTGLVLSDRLLTVVELSQASRGGDLAFLSSCDSATGPIVGADEVVTLAGALYFTGWRQVVGTLAPVVDSVARDVARLFYTNLAPLTAKQLDCASALHRAVTDQMELYPDSPSLWSSFVHYGI